MSSNIKWTCILEQSHRRQREAIVSMTNQTTICHKVFQRGDFMTKITQWFQSVSPRGAELLSQTPAMSGRSPEHAQCTPRPDARYTGLQQQHMLGPTQRGSQAPGKLASDQTEAWRWHRIDLCLPQGTADPIPEVHSGVIENSLILQHISQNLKCKVEDYGNNYFARPGAQSAELGRHPSLLLPSRPHTAFCCCPSTAYSNKPSGCSEPHYGNFWNLGAHRPIRNSPKESPCFSDLEETGSPFFPFPWHCSQKMDDRDWLCGPESTKG